VPRAHCDGLGPLSEEDIVREIIVIQEHGRFFVVPWTVRRKFVCKLFSAASVRETCSFWWISLKCAAVVAFSANSWKRKREILSGYKVTDPVARAEI
jgi:hypothetical protein